MFKKQFLAVCFAVLAVFFLGCSEELDPEVIIGDTTPPEASFTSPASGATMSTAFVISADAADPESRIVAVSFYVRNVLVNTVIASNLPANTVNYSSDLINPADLAEGNCTLKVVAVNGKGLMTTITRDVVISHGSVVDTTPPVLGITQPTAGQNLSNDFKISASAADAESGITVVRFYANGTLLGSASTPVSGTTFESALLTLTNLPEGANIIEVVAVNGNLLATTNTVSVTVVYPATVSDTVYTTLVFPGPSAPVGGVNLDVLDPYFSWNTGTITGILSYRVTVWDMTGENVFFWLENVSASRTSLQYGEVPAGSTVEQPAVDLVSGTEYYVAIVALNIADSRGSSDENHIGFTMERFTVSGMKKISRSAVAAKPMTRADYLARLQAIRAGN